MVQIVKDHIFVRVSGVEEAFLEPLLTYVHRQASRQPVLSSNGGYTRTKAVTLYEKRKLYGLLPDGSVMFQHGLLPRVMQALKAAGKEFELIIHDGRLPEPDFENMRRAFPGFEFRNSQDLIVSIITALSCGQIVAPAGFGKCFKKDTPVLMYDGSVKMIQDIKNGDVVMGPDSGPRVVCGCTSGDSQMYDIKPTYGGMVWGCNEEHILHTVRTGDVKSLKGTYDNRTVKSWLSSSRTFTHNHKLRRVPVEFKEAPVDIDPYVYGAWLGDGSSGAVSFTTMDAEVVDYLDSWAFKNGLLRSKYLPVSGRSKTYMYIANHGTGSTKCYGNPIRQWFRARPKSDGIRREYLVNSREVRLQLLAGLLDTDGTVSKRNGLVVGLGITTKHKKLADDIVFLCNTLGLPAVSRQCRKKCCNTGVIGTYYSVGIRGDTSVVPLKIPRKRVLNFKGNRDPLVHGFEVIPTGVGTYYGFTIDGPDNLFLLGDCTVVHNTSVISLVCALYPKERIIVATPGASLAKDTHMRLASVFGTDVGLVGAGGDSVGRITVCTYHSLHKVHPDKVDIVLVDEAHKAAQNLLAEPLTRFVKAKKVFGFTATPKGRSDNAELVVEALLGPVVMTVDYQAAQTHGSVVPMKAIFVDVQSGPPGEDFEDSDRVVKLRNLYWKNVYRNKKIVEALRAYTDPGNPLELEDPQILILVETTTHLAALSRMLPDFETVYKSTGRSGLPKLSAKEIDNKFKRFQSGELRRVIATCCWGTGVDFPGLDMVVMASGNTSPIEVVQRTGRCTRVSSDKLCGHVLDFTDSWARWPASRSASRRREYKKMGWDIYG